MAIISPTLQRCYAQAPNVVKETKIYCNSTINDTNKIMIEVRSAIPNIIYELRYATINNFTGKKLYRNGKQTFLRAPVVKALTKVEEELKQKGLTLKIFDAYRPYAVTQRMWDLIHDERYVADPSKGSGHNRGIAVDLTIVDCKTEKELDMGTGFDNFTDSAHHSFRNLPDSVLASRHYLRSLMEQNGFKALETEWWHYSFPNDRNYEVLDIDFKQLKKSCH